MLSQYLYTALYLLRIYLIPAWCLIRDGLQVFVELGLCLAHGPKFGDIEIEIASDHLGKDSQGNLNKLYRIL